MRVLSQEGKWFTKQVNEALRVGKHQRAVDVVMGKIREDYKTERLDSFLKVLGADKVIPLRSQAMYGTRLSYALIGNGQEIQSTEMRCVEDMFVHFLGSSTHSPNPRRSPFSESVCRTRRGDEGV
eukprot:Hpha_TRINITY_DN16691_c1_g2::TRINITY_DN16691_c1_g2_i13::g.179619::m.179619